MTNPKQELREIKRDFLEWHDDGYPVTPEAIESAMIFLDTLKVSVADTGTIYINGILEKHLISIGFCPDGNVIPVIVNKNKEKL